MAKLFFFSCFTHSFPGLDAVVLGDEIKILHWEMRAFSHLVPNVTKSSAVVVEVWLSVDQ